MTRARVWGRLLLAALAGGLVDPGLVYGQEDFRNVDPGRPIRVEDAYSLKYREWELELGIRPEFREGGPALYTAVAELKTGLYYDLQTGIEVHSALRSGGGLDSELGLEEVAVHLMYTLGQETTAIPGLGVRGDLLIPAGGALGRDELGVQVTGLATRSFGRLRVHGNLGYRFEEETEGGPVLEPLEGQDAWFGGLAFDYPIGLFSRMVLGDVFFELPIDRGRARVIVELGVRLQLHNRWVLDMGLSSAISEWDEHANGAVIAGLSYVFGLPWLVGVPSYLDPTVDR